MCFSTMMALCIKQHLSNIWSSIHVKLKQHWNWVEKKLASFEFMNKISSLWQHKEIDLGQYQRSPQHNNDWSGSKQLKHSVVVVLLSLVNIF